MRDAAFACIRRVGVETGGSNVQFAVDPDTGEQVVIEMNPRVSRSSALASKATGFPIAKIAAKLAVGYTLDEIPNDITTVVDPETGAVIRSTPASFEPVIDYVVTKVPRWAFEKLPGAEPRLGHPDAVGGRGDGHRTDVPRVAPEGAPLARARPRRTQRRSRPRPRSTPCAITELLARAAVGHPGADLRGRVAAAPWRAARRRVRVHPDRSVVPRPDPRHRRGTRSTWSPREPGSMRSPAMYAPRLAAGQAAGLRRRPARPPVGHRPRPRCARPASLAGVEITYKTVDTCAAEFEAATPYHYGTYEDTSRGGAVGPGQGHHPRVGPEPDRPGHRVRLLLRARLLRAGRGRLRDDHGQLQPRDRVDRLRHLRPAVLRAARRPRACST